MSSGDPPITLREALGMLRRDLPGQARLWLLIGGLIALLVGLAGRYSWPEAVAIGISFLPIAIPVGPMVWLSPRGSGANVLNRRGAWRLAGLFTVWGVATLLPAAFLAFAVLRLGGVM